VTHPVVQVLTAGTIAELARADRTDGQLLDLFVRQRDEEAFAAVVRRHGPMVLGVCRRVLRNHADADDAFQAAFLVLARKAATLTRGLLAQWLYGVAYNTARKLRQANARRAVRERPLAEVAELVAPGASDLRDELIAVLDEELDRLPERYRAPVVLCDLQGATRKEAARLLGCPEGTVAGRLARARALLAQRLAGRGVVPAAGVVVAVLSERAAYAVLPALVADIVCSATGGAVSIRVTEAAEGVLKAMFNKKLKTAAVAVLLCGFVLAGVAGLLRAQDGPDPPPPASGKAGDTTDPRARPAPAAPAQAGKKVLTVIPLKKLEPADAAKRLTAAYKDAGVTVAPLPADKAVLVYADAKTTAAIEDLLNQLGEERPKKPTVIHLDKATDCKDAARTMTEVFNGKAGAFGEKAGATPRVTVVPVPDENILLVYATELDTLTIRRLLGNAVLAEGRDPAKPAPAAEPKKYTFGFRNTPWADVLDWYAKESGLTDVSTSKPKGTVTIVPPQDQKLTFAEITDLINESLMAQKFILVRGGRTFLVHPADERIDPALVPQVELAELDARGRTELVQVVIRLTGQKAADVAPDVKKLLGPFGELRVLDAGNLLVVTDTAGNLRRLVKLLRDIDIDTAPPAKKPEGEDSLTHQCRWKKAQDVADQVKTLLAEKPAEGGDTTGRGKPVQVAVDTKANTLHVTAPPDKVALVKKLVEEIDKPAKPGDRPITPPDPELRKYSVPPGTAEAVVKTLLKEMPSLRVIALTASNEIMVLATPDELAAVEAKLKGTGENSEKKDSKEKK
jgi:RNA polymerase sigma factor (sigma-70 family)